jgi:signal recognition particle GTPase
MVLAELGARLTSALHRLNSSTVVDDEVVTSILSDISRSLLESDVNIKIVGKLRNTIKSRLNLEDEAMGTNKRKLVQRVVMEELVLLLRIFLLHHFELHCQRIHYIRNSVGSNARSRNSTLCDAEKQAERRHVCRSARCR